MISESEQRILKKGAPKQAENPIRENPCRAITESAIQSENSDVIVLRHTWMERNKHDMVHS